MKRLEVGSLSEDLGSVLKNIPLAFPERYESAIKAYSVNPDEGIDALERFMIKAGEDGVGLMLLSLMHHCANNLNKAVNYAEKARFMVSGSSFFKALSYRLRHPEGFDAWIPEKLFNDEPKLEQNPILTAPTAELDELIDVLSDVENTKIRLDSSLLSAPPPQEDIALEKEVDDIYTETLAQIYMQQNQYLKAQKIYLRLLDLEPDKSAKWLEKLALIDQKIA